MNLVEIKNNEPITTTLKVSEGMNLKHRAIMVLIDKYKNNLETFGVLTFEMSKPLGKKGGRPKRFAYINEGQTTFLITLMRNSKLVIRFKQELTREFFRQRKLIANLLTQRQNSAWIEQRKHGIVARKEETGVIKEFIEYAVNQGSSQAHRCYSNISKMENKALFLLQQRFPNVRDVLSGYQLSIIASADIIVCKALESGMNDGLNYREIYKIAKERIESFANLIGKTQVPMALKSLIT